MAAPHQFDNHLPLWPAGQFVPLTLEEIRTRCVEAFPDSVTRAGLMNDFLLVVGRLQALGVEGEIWLDGSFVTTKASPTDIDFVLFADPDQYDAGDGEMRFAVDGLIDVQADWPPPSCDTWVVFFNGEIRNYWEKRFGTEPTKGSPKGIIVVRLKNEVPEVLVDEEPVDEEQVDEEGPAQ